MFLNKLVMNRTRDDEVLKKFGANLKRIRESKNLSLRKLADIANVETAFTLRHDENRWTIHNNFSKAHL